MADQYYPPTAPDAAGYPPPHDQNQQPEAGYPLAPYPTDQNSTDPQPPSSGYSEKPPQAPYPQQQTDYPQQAAYPQETAYPQQGFSGQAPPPSYYPQQQAQQQATSNVVVVNSQPQPVVVARPLHQHSNAGQTALIFAIVVSVCLFVFQCYWGLICSVIGIVLASNATSAAGRGDVDKARSSSNASIGATVGGIVFGVVGAIAIIGGIIGFYASLLY